MDGSRDMRPGEKPLDIEKAFGEPDALEKAAARMALHDWCEKEKMHCPWLSQCQNNPNWLCPLYYEERSRADENSQITTIEWH